MDTWRRLIWAIIGMLVGYILLASVMALAPGLLDFLRDFFTGSRPPVIIKGGSLELSTFTGRLELQDYTQQYAKKLAEEKGATYWHIRLISFCPELEDKDYSKVLGILVEMDNSSERYLKLELDDKRDLMLFKPNAELTEDKDTKIWSHSDGANRKITKLTLNFTEGDPVSWPSKDDDGDTEGLKFVIWVN